MAGGYTHGILITYFTTYFIKIQTANMHITLKSCTYYIIVPIKSLMTNHVLVFNRNPAHYALTVIHMCS